MSELTMEKDSMTMARSAEEFRHDKQALIDRVKSLLRDAIVSNSRSARSRVAEAISSGLDELGGMIDQVVAIRADMIAGAIAGRRLEIEPAICSSCLNRLTETAEQLDDHIESAVRHARGYGWPADICREKLRNAMRPGDRVILLAWGRLTVGRPDGSAFIVYQRDS
jgi:hypothetical protein